MLKFKFVNLFKMMENLLETSRTHRTLILWFLGNQRPRDRVIGLFLLIQKKILILRQNGNIDYTKEEDAISKCCRTTLATSMKNTWVFSSTCRNSVNSRQLLLRFTAFWLSSNMSFSVWSRWAQNSAQQHRYFVLKIIFIPWSSFNVTIGCSQLINNNGNNNNKTLSFHFAYRTRSLSNTISQCVFQQFNGEME